MSHVPTFNVPKPTEPLDINLFNSPPAAHMDNSRPGVSSAVAQDTVGVAVKGPKVIVEPSYETREQLRRKFKARDFAGVGSILTSFSTGTRNCSIVGSVIELIKQHPLPQEKEKNLTPSEIAISIISSIVKNGMFSTFAQKLSN